MRRIIMHMDMDAFFVSVEIKDKPWLLGKPVAVCGDVSKRSVIATSSYEARKCGVHSAMPVFKAIKICPNLILLKANHKKYAEISEKIISILYSYCPSVETSSIDEAFLDLTYTVKNFEEAELLAKKIKTEIIKKLGLPLTIGISSNKLLAKLASKIGKPNGLKIILPEKTKSILKDTPVEMISGIGPKTSEILKEKFNVHTLGELKKIPLLTLSSVFNSYALFLYNAARGIDRNPVMPDYEKTQAKSVGNSITLPFDTDNMEYLKKVLEYIAFKVAGRLREKRLYAKNIILVVRFSDFRTKTKRMKIRPTNTGKTIYLASLCILKGIKTRKKIRLLGITASDLIGSPALNLFDTSKAEIKNTIIEETMDKIKAKYGENLVTFASIYEAVKKEAIKPLSFPETYRT
ncbi:MAG: DNA polymerase IV [Caldisericaceae bacterium]|nr:DNA polymerase IV [Caldisericaceae bacterium]